MITLGHIFLILLVLTVFVVLLAGGIMEYLRQIRDAIRENYEASLARAMSTTDLVVTPEKERVAKSCTCNHGLVQHWTVAGESGPAVQGGKCHHTDDTGKPDCACPAYRPKRGPWPGENKI